MTESKSPDESLHDQLTDSSKSQIERYKSLVLGSSSFWYLLKFELIMLFCSWVPGALGLLLRKALYPKILGGVGRNVVFGQGVTIYHGMKIFIGNNVVIGDRTVLDAKGNNNKGIKIGKDTIISQNVILSCKNGDIEIKENCTIGINTLVHAVEGSNVSIGSYVLVGAFSYFVGGGTYGTSELEIPFKKQEVICKGGINVADNVWVGSNVQVLDGATIGTGSILGASTVINKDVEEYSVVAGIPMKVIRSRK